MGAVRLLVAALFVYLGYREIQDEPTSLFGWLIIAFAVIAMLGIVSNMRTGQRDRGGYISDSSDFDGGDSGGSDG